MSELTKASSSVSGGANWRRRGGDRNRGFPKFCRCGAEAVIRTSGTAKNPGRLFYCSPNGSEDKYHLFTWTDERMVEEIEDVKSQLKDFQDELSTCRSDIVGLEKQVEQSKVMINLMRERNACCVIL